MVETYWIDIVLKRFLGAKSPIGIHVYPNSHVGERKVKVLKALVEAGKLRTKDLGTLTWRGLPKGTQQHGVLAWSKGRKVGAIVSCATMNSWHYQAAKRKLEKEVGQELDPEDLHYWAV